jgi:predicted acetyltransferase
MDVELREATPDDKPVLRRLLELNAHDLSDIDGRVPGPTGEYGYPYLDHYWVEDDRHPFLVTVDDAPAGCLLVRAGEPHRFGEVFVVRSHRRRGVGTAVVGDALARFPGPWLVEVLPGNEGALAFWRRTLPADHEEHVTRSGTTFRLRIDDPT